MIRSNSSSEGFGGAEEGIWENKFFASARVWGKGEGIWKNEGNKENTSSIFLFLRF